MKQLTLDLLLSTHDNVIAVGYGKKSVGGEYTDEDALVFTVKEKKHYDSLGSDLIPPYIEFDGGVHKTDVVQDTLIFHTNADFPPGGARDNDDQHFAPGHHNTESPIVGGVSINNQAQTPGFTGTIGLIARDAATNAILGVTNNHVISDLVAVEPSESRNTPEFLSLHNPADTEIQQPSQGFGGAARRDIGRFYKNIPYTSTPANNTTDIACFTLYENEFDETSWHQKNQTFFNTHGGPPAFATTAEIDALVGGDNAVEVYASGTRTGAKGEGEIKMRIKSNPVSAAVTGKDGEFDSTLVFTKCFTFEAYDPSTGTVCPGASFGGDSGSAVMARIGGETKVIGFLFAGPQLGTSGTACRIDEVATKLNIIAWDGVKDDIFEEDPSFEVFPGVIQDDSKIIDGVTYYRSGVTLAPATQP